ncbi:MAG: hypothetical protein ACT4PJ_16440 [Gemmatimonadaceae bacterium]
MIRPFGPMVGLAAAAVLRGAVLASPAAAQSVEAQRIAGTSPRLDGRLTEGLWNAGASLTGFLQRDPDEGDPATERTEVRFAYDDEALWIGARRHSTSLPSASIITTRLTTTTTATRASTPVWEARAHIDRWDGRRRCEFPSRSCASVPPMSRRGT